MKFLGVDYGTKRVGLAVSDEAGKIAFPLSVVTNDSTLLAAVKKICDEQTVSSIIIGESKDFAGEDNPVMKNIAHFAETLKQSLGREVVFEPEFLTSAEAKRILGETKMHDASAAALILQSYLDKMNRVKTAEKTPAAKVANPKISFDDFKKIEITVGKILSAEKIPDADKLFKLSVDFAEAAPRQIVSGIAPYFQNPADLVGRKCLFVTNLEPRTIRGYVSDGMILALSGADGAFSLLEPNASIPAGTKAK